MDNFTRRLDLPLLGDILDCKRCSLYTHSYCGPIHGVGDPSSDLLVVSTSHNTEEENLGQCCEGREWTFFKRLVANSDLHPWYTKLIKCRPKGVKNLQPHIDVCKGWLWEEIKQLRPKAILSLGREPTFTLLRLKKSFAMKTIIGRPQVCDYLLGATVFPWYNAEYIFSRGQSVTKDTIKQLNRIKELLSVRTNSV